MEDKPKGRNIFITKCGHIFCAGCLYLSWSRDIDYSVMQKVGTRNTAMDEERLCLTYEFGLGKLRYLIYFMSSKYHICKKSQDIVQMASLGKKLIFDLARLSGMCYKPKEEIECIYKDKRPYNKQDNACVFNTLKVCPILYKSEDDCEVLVCKHETEKLIIAFRGTSSREDVLTDLTITRDKLPLVNVKEDEWPLVHSGFLDQFFSVYKNLDDSVKENNQIVFCGHSLGGALATIGSLYYSYQYPDKDIACVTFGSPRVGDDRFVSYFDERIEQSMRYVNDNDPVPCVPTRWRFKHVKGLQWLNQDQIQKEIQVWRFYRFLKNTLLSVVGYGYNACDDHKCDNYIDDLRSIFF